jgi:hypothetical protein
MLAKHEAPMPLLSINGSEEETGERPAFRVKTASTKLTESEMEAFSEIAATRNLKPSDLIREYILSEIERSKSPLTTDPNFTEIIALRMFIANALRVLCTGEKMTRNEFEMLLSKVHESKYGTASELAQKYRDGKVE